MNLPSSGFLVHKQKAFCPAQHFPKSGQYAKVNFRGTQLLLKHCLNFNKPNYHIKLMTSCISKFPPKIKYVSENKKLSGQKKILLMAQPYG